MAMRYPTTAIPDAAVPRAASPLFQHLVDTYASESNKVVSVWLAFAPDDVDWRPHPRSSTVAEVMKHQLLSERRFFERVARHVGLRALASQYIDCVSPKHWSSDPFRGAGFWTSILTPAGALGAVPLALADVGFVDTAIRHLRGCDLDHETFQRAFIAELVRRHGYRDETLRLIAFRAVDGQGQSGVRDLQWLVAEAGFRAVVAGSDGLSRFAHQVDLESQRREYRALYVANAGKGLFFDAPERFEAWLAFFEARGLQFDEYDRTLRASDPYAPPPWEEAWEEAASCTDRD